MDGDRDLDAFVRNFGQSRLAINLAFPVAWRGTPRVGKPLTVDIRGPALGVSLANASLPIPPLGTLRLDPATLLVVAGGSFDPQGRASLPLLVPPNPALVGGSFFWQAVVGPPPLLTNLEVTTLTDL
ncbi:MAG: hypothetical protein L0323_03330 [Planctomycetes bacterium]|nr:hypothetical protein [Planctomycetota bacterium]